MNSLRRPLPLTLGFSALLIFLSLLLSGFATSVFAQDEAAFLFLPSTGTYQAGDEFSVDLNIRTSTPVTSLKAYLAFNQDLLSVAQLNVNKNIFPYWWEQESTPGLVKLQASTPSPGFDGEGTIATIRFKATRAGNALVAIDPSSLILTSRDENILDGNSLPQARFLLAAVQQVSGLPQVSISSPGVVVFFLLAGVSVIFFIGMWMRSKLREERKKRE